MKIYQNIELWVSVCTNTMSPIIEVKENGVVIQTFKGNQTDPDGLNDSVDGYLKGYVLNQRILKIKNLIKKI